MLLSCGFAAVCLYAANGSVLDVSANAEQPSVPVTAFSLLTIAELTVFLFNAIGPTAVYAYLRVPAMSVHGTTLLYYLWENSMEAGTGLREDVFGRPLYPLRYVMWTLSVSKCAWQDMSKNLARAPPAGLPAPVSSSGVRATAHPAHATLKRLAQHDNDYIRNLPGGNPAAYQGPVTSSSPGRR
jgi:hypothetical protein